MVYRLVCSLVYGMCIASGGFAAAQSADTVKEEPAVQTEDKRSCGLRADSGSKQRNRSQTSSNSLRNKRV